jgi:hypothetical protein
MAVAVLSSCSTGQPAWLKNDIKDCAVGTIGLTFKRSTAIRRAGEEARLRLAAQRLGVAVQAVLSEDGDRAREVMLHTTDGVLKGAQVVAVWTDNRRGSDSSLRTHALACLGSTPDVATSGRPEGMPDWVLDAPRNKRQLCALGVAGLTLEPKDQPLRAEEDARARLAETLGVWAKYAWLDDSSHGAFGGGQASSLPGAAETAKSAALEGTWTDATGEGPLGQSQLIYALVCISRR